MFFVIDNNIEIIDGAKNSCIYNLNTGKLYIIDSIFKKNLLKVLEMEERDLDIKLKEIRDNLINEKILVNPTNLSSKINISDYSLPKITFAWIEITQNCNLRCKHCYENSDANINKNDMSISDFIKVINRLEEEHIKNIQLIGGEPLLHVNLNEMIDMCKHRFEYIEIFTNGTLLNDDLLKKIKNDDIRLAFSLYSKENQIHDEVTQIKGSFDNTYRNIKKALDLGIECRVASVEMKDAPKYSLESINVEHHSDLPRIVGKANINLYNRDMLRKKLITKKSFSKPIKASIIYSNIYKHNCFGNKIYVDVNLNVFPCVMERRFIHGNIRENKIHDIIDFEIIKLNKDTINDCKLCELRYACYDCRPDSINNLKNEKPWFCTYDPRTGNWEKEEEFINNLIYKYR